MIMKFTNGLPETACGAGSRVSYTTELRRWITRLMEELKVNKLVDAPCGDFNWMAHTDLSSVDYVGLDFDYDHLVAAGRQSVPITYSPRSKMLLQFDLVTGTLPRADMILCREFLQHLPNALALAVLQNFVSSGTRWLLTTSHNNLNNRDLVKAGGFRPLNLMQPPFSFPSPVRSVEDARGSGRILGLWSLKYVAQSAA